MKKQLTILIASLLAPLVAMAGEYRAIVETAALSEPTMHESSAKEVLHVYQSGDTVETKSPESCSKEICEVILPGGQKAWVVSHKITNHPDLATELSYFQKVSWDDMSKYQLRIWAMEKGNPGVMHYCGIKLASGETLDKAGSMDAFCNDFRHTREVQEAARAIKEAMETMGRDDREKLLNGGVPIGAPKAAVLVSWGEPNDTTRTITKDSVAEQMIYDDRVAYIENGKVAMIQE